MHAFRGCFKLENSFVTQIATVFVVAHYRPCTKFYSYCIPVKGVEKTMVVRSTFGVKLWKIRKAFKNPKILDFRLKHCSF